MANNLTPKQSAVLKKLNAGDHPNKIAKSMGITRSGVYQHVAGIRKAGIAVPNARSKGAGKKSVGRPRGSLNVQVQGSFIDTLAASLRDEIAAKDRQRAQILDERARLHNALMALAA